MKKLSKLEMFIYIIILFLIVWVSALLSTLYQEHDLLYIIMNFNVIFNNPFHIIFTKETLQFVLLVLLLYVILMMYMLTSKRKNRLGQEFDSGRWATSKEVNDIVMDKKNPQGNLILSQNIRLSLQTHIIQRNLNVLVIGGPGSGKSRGYVIPNILQANTSFVITDPKGELLARTGNFLEQEGYVVKVFNLVDARKSMHYNPFDYLDPNRETEVLSLVNNYILNTVDPNVKSSDPFWDDAAKCLLSALFFYVLNYAPSYEKNLTTVAEMIFYLDVGEDSDKSPLDLLFDELEKYEPDAFCIKQYRIFRSGASKTLQSIIITTLMKLKETFISDIQNITFNDELELDQVGDRKTALFLVIPDNDTSLNFLIGLLYTQLFQLLYRKADNSADLRLKIPVHMVLDEMANVKLPNNFSNYLSTMRSRNIFCSMIIQGVSQMKTLFKDIHENLMGDCDAWIYLGNNEESTQKNMSNRLGNENLEKSNIHVTKGAKGSTSVNSDIYKRELMTFSEVAKMSNKKSMVFIKGLDPVFDDKFDLTKHKNYKFTSYVTKKNYEYVRESHAIEGWHDVTINSSDDLEIIREN